MNLVTIHLLNDNFHRSNQEPNAVLLLLVWQLLQGSGTKHAICVSAKTHYGNILVFLMVFRPILTQKYSSVPYILRKCSKLLKIMKFTYKGSCIDSKHNLPTIGPFTRAPLPEDRTSLGHVTHVNHLMLTQLLTHFYMTSGHSQNLSLPDYKNLRLSQLRHW